MNNYYKYKESHLKAQKRWKENNPDKVKAYAKKKYEKIKLYKKTYDNWNSLREWLEEQNKFYEVSTMGYSYGVICNVLDKMNELEGVTDE